MNILSAILISILVHGLFAVLFPIPRSNFFLLQQEYILMNISADMGEKISHGSHQMHLIETL